MFRLEKLIGARPGFKPTPFGSQVEVHTWLNPENFDLTLFSFTNNSISKRNNSVKSKTSHLVFISVTETAIILRRRFKFECRSLIGRGTSEGVLHWR